DRSLDERGTPIRSCSWRGLPCRRRYRRRGALLPHPFTLAPDQVRGGLLSVALSLGSPPAGVTRRHVVVEPGLSSSARRRPRPPGRLVRAEGDLWRGRGQGRCASSAATAATKRLRPASSSAPATPQPAATTSAMDWP